MNNCIFCETTDNLNTQMTISLDDGIKVSVDICDEHAEEATVKTARECYLKRKRQIDEVMEQARKLGLQVVEGNQGILIPQKVEKAPPPRSAQPAPAQVIEAEIVEEDGEMIDTARVDAQLQKGMRSVGGTVAGTSVASHQSIDTSEAREQLPADALKGKVKMDVLPGRGGQPIAIPTKRVDGTGRTDINIVESNDAQLQRRFKQIAEMSKSPLGWEQMHDHRHGYNVTECPICHGATKVKNRGQEITCPKCKGKGQIDV